MKTCFQTLLVLTSALLAMAQSPYSSLQVPKQIQYQGRVATGTGGAWSGTEGYFAFALVQGATVLWNNWEGTASPSDPGAVSLGAGQVLTLPVNQGVFSIRLGEGSDTNEQIPATAFIDSSNDQHFVRAGVKLAVWFSPNGSPPFTRLGQDGNGTHDLEFATVPYAMVAGVAESVKGGAENPPGTILAFGGEDIPYGYLLCDGASYDRSGTYAKLFATIGTAYGTTSLSTFTVPDFRGLFLRGRNRGLNRDPDAASRSIFNPGGNGGDALGSIEYDGFRIHTHGIDDPGHAHQQTYNNSSGNVANGFPPFGGGSQSQVGAYNTGSSTTGISIQGTGGNETRPVNVYVNYIIKY